MEFTYKSYEGRKKKVLWEEEKEAGFFNSTNLDSSLATLAKFLGWKYPEPAVYAEPQTIVWKVDTV